MKKIRSINTYVDPATGLSAARMLKAIKHINEIMPPRPSFHHANISAARPTPKTANRIIL